MKRLLPLLLFTGFCLLSVSTVQAESNSPEPYGGQKICLPDIYLAPNQDCLPLGPSQTLTSYAQQGIELPVPPLPIQAPQANLTQVPYQYAKLVESNAPIFSTPSNALSGTPQRTLSGHIVYLSYNNVDKTEAGSFYQFHTGEWISRSSITPNQAWSRFQGVILTQTPRTSFGWIRDTAETQNSPGFGGTKTGNKLYRFNMVWVYTVQKVDNVDWAMVGVDEWIEKRLVARVTPDLNPPQGVSGSRWIDVNLDEQTLAVYENGRMIFATLVSSGVQPFYTLPGTFKIYKKLTSEQMSGTFTADRSDYYYLEDVPWTMYFDGDRALHGAYWHSHFGYPTSHGCVNLSVGDSRWLFDWAKEGDWVHVWDPTGNTPTTLDVKAGP